MLAPPLFRIGVKTLGKYPPIPPAAMLYQNELGAYPLQILNPIQNNRKATVM